MSPYASQTDLLTRQTELMLRHAELLRVISAFSLDYCNTRTFFNMVIYATVAICKVPNSRVAQAIGISIETVNRYVDGSDTVRTAFNDASTNRSSPDDLRRACIENAIVPLLRQRTENLQRIVARRSERIEAKLFPALDPNKIDLTNVAKFGDRKKS